jgi:hypothetical protein
MTLKDNFVQRAVVVDNVTGMKDRTTMRLALVNESGAVWSPDAANIKLTGYTSGSADNVSAADSVNAAIAKLEARIAALESA